MPGQAIASRDLVIPQIPNSIYKNKWAVSTSYCTMYKQVISQYIILAHGLDSIVSVH
jgi:hypothetical protein